jgi:hypothetical protein
MAFLQYKTGAIKEKSNPRGDERTEETKITKLFVTLKITK